jgi:hypothetical protein
MAKSIQAPNGDSIFGLMIKQRTAYFNYAARLPDAHSVLL